MMHVLVTRPEPDATTMAAKLESLGHRATRCPLLEIRYEMGEAVSLRDVQAIIATSRHGLRSLAQRPAFKDALALPVFAVGPATAEEARALGFSCVFQGPASASDLMAVIETHARPADGTLLYLAGNVLAFDLKSALERNGFAVRQQTAYRSVAARALDPQVVDAIRSESLDGVILMSERSATTFQTLMHQAGVADAARKLTFYCLSQEVARSLDSLPSDKVVVAAKPNSEEMLALFVRGASESR